jgi:hypothetical protein
MSDQPSVRGSAEEIDATCVVCRLPVNPTDRSGAVEREIEGWVVVRRRGSSKVVDRHPTGRYRHHICGADPELPGQLSLIEGADA